MVEIGSEKAPAVSRAIRILDLLAAAGGSTRSLSEIARFVGIAKSSTSNICAALEEGGLLSRNDLGYALGRRTFEWGAAYLRSFDPVREFYRIAAEGTSLAAELLQIAVLDGTDVLFVAKHDGRSPLGHSVGVGQRYPAALSAVGRSLLARLSDEEIRTLFADPKSRPALTERSIRTLDDLLAEIARTRQRGYAVDEAEVYSNAVCFAKVILRNVSGDPTLAFGVTLLRSSATKEYRGEILVQLMDAVTRLSDPLAELAGES